MTVITRGHHGADQGHPKHGNSDQGIPPVDPAVEQVAQQHLGYRYANHHHQQQNQQRILQLAQATHYLTKALLHFGIA